MKFIVITAKHHDGFSLFGTKLSSYNVVDGSPYRRDVIKELAAAARAEGLSFGVYYSSIDWHWGSVPDKQNNNPIPKELADFNLGQLVELCSNYGPLSEIWFDMGNPTPEQSKRWTDAVHTLQPDTMVSGRVFNHQGDFTVMGDNAIPDHRIDEPWQTPGSVYGDTSGLPFLAGAPGSVGEGSRAAGESGKGGEPGRELSAEYRPARRRHRRGV